MLRSIPFTCVLIFLLFPSINLVKPNDDYLTNEALSWAEVTATRLVTCYYHDLTGLWKNEEAWQSGNTLESLANFVSLVDSPLKYVFNHTFKRTDIYAGGNCYDDHQWWLLAWIQVYQVEPDIKYLHRAALIHDTISKKAWKPTKCQGGVQWCPTNAYKNAITNELFLASSMRLHPYATLLRKPSTYYLDWALKEWQWFESSGMINSDYLINDGLRPSDQSSRTDVNSITDNTCVNNNQTIWTYNQGVILSGLALLYNATHNSTLLHIAQNIVDATIQHLTYANGILKEPCEPTCDNDQKLFKGIFARHLSYLLPYLTDPLQIDKYGSFLQQNAISLWTTNRCESDGLFGLIWNNTSSNDCDSARDSATTSSALDLFIALAKTHQQGTTTSKWMLLGMGNCMDDQNFSMPNIYRSGVNESVCRMTADDDLGGVAYDYELKCDGSGFCRIRTLSDRHVTPAGWTYEDGNGVTVTRTNKMILTNCYLRTD